MNESEYKEHMFSRKGANCHCTKCNAFLSFGKARVITENEKFKLMCVNCYRKRDKDV